MMLTTTAAATKPGFRVKKVQKKLKKFGKRVARDRRGDLARIGERFRDIADDEQRRSRELLEQHRAFFQNGGVEEKVEETSIDFFVDSK